jgi:site-specific DNA-methyltransferase (adenine-specific)
MTQIKLLKGDCLDKLKELEDNSVDSVVTDPPYHLTSIVKRFGKQGSAPAQYGTDGAYARAAKGFMGKEWDGGDIAFRPDVWEECYRVLKPGGHLLAFSHSRTYHRMGVAVEDAGFEIRDQILWVYGSGFPKSHNVGNSIDKLNGAGNRGHAISSGNRFHATTGKPRPNGEKLDKYEARTEEGKGWEGWGTALKPAHEPIVMARKPLSEKSVARNVLEWGTGAINIDECRVGTEKVSAHHAPKGTFAGGEYDRGSSKEYYETEGRFPANIIFECTCENPQTKPAPKSGHWPKGKTKGFGEFGGGESSYEGAGPKESGNMIIHTDPNCPCYQLDEQSGNIKGGKPMPPFQGKPKNDINFTSGVKEINRIGYNDTGGASRFFYCPKASKKDRNEGCENLEDKSVSINTPHNSKDLEERYAMTSKNNHPTVKPTDLMTYLVRLVTPKGGLVLDPFMGSGSTGKAAVREGFDFIGIEREDEYMEIAKTRIEHEQSKHNYRNFWE